MDVSGIARMIWGLNIMETPVFEGNRIYYNFIRPHMGLNGKTPAEVAGIGISEENKRMGLIKVASQATKND
jgi:hypothetical protein